MSEDRQVTGTLWDALSKVYNMDNVPEEAKSIIGDVMLGLPSEEPEPERNTTSEQPVSDRLGVKTGETCTDTIYRRDAIDALMAWEEVFFWDDECLKHRGEPYWIAPSDVIESLPSAQPEPEHTMGEFMYGQGMGNPEDGSL